MWFWCSNKCRLTNSHVHTRTHYQVLGPSTSTAAVVMYIKKTNTHEQTITHTPHTQSPSSTQTHTVPLAIPDMCDLISDRVLQRSAKMKTLEDSRCSCALPLSLPPTAPPSPSHLWTWTHTHTHTLLLRLLHHGVQPGSDPGRRCTC